MQFRCVSALPSGWPAGSHHRQLEGRVQSWLPGEANAAKFALAWLLRGELSGCTTCLPLLPCNSVWFCFSELSGDAPPLRTYRTKRERKALP